MKYAFPLSFLCIAAFLMGCHPHQMEKPAAEPRTHLISESYRAPAFRTDERKAIVKKLAPAIDSLMMAHIKQNNIPGVAYGIVVDGDLVLASGTGRINLETDAPATSKSSFRIASMTKSFTAMAILKLRDEGQLSLQDPASKYLPEMKSLAYLTEDAPAITLENLLTMTSGFPEDNPWGDRQLDEPEQMLLDLLEGGISFSNIPSYGFEYSNTGYALLGAVISRVSGKPYQEYIHDNILVPLGLEHTYWEFEKVPKEQLALGYRWEDSQWKGEPMLHDGAYGAMGGIITSIEDFSNYVSYQLSAWPPRSGEDNGPVKRSSLREMQTPQFTRLYADATNYFGVPCAVIAGYGFGLGIAENCNGLKWVSHGGALPGFGSNYVFYPEYGIGLMAFCNLTYTSPWPLKDIGKLLFESPGLQPRELPASEILKIRQKQLVALLQHWDTASEEQFLAENFYLDKSRDDRMKAAQKVLDSAGAFLKIDTVMALNQLRGTFKIAAENGIIEIFFTLTPEKEPKVQYLDISLKPLEKP